MSNAPGLRIVEYYAENFKRLKFVQFRPAGRMQVFTGKNDQGKTSALDAIPFVLGGKKWSPEVPRRRGSQHMKVRLDLGELIVTRTDSGLTVEPAKGQKAWGTPQQMLDSLFDELSFDPMEFVRMKAKDQVDMLRRCVKLDVDPEQLDAENAADFDRRREINREVARLAAEIAGIPLQEGLPKEKLDEAAIEQEIEEANKQNRSMAQRIETRAQMQRSVEEAITARDRNDQFIRECETQIARLEQECVTQEHRHRMAAQLVKQLRADLDLVNDPAFFPSPQIKLSLQAAFLEAETVGKDSETREADAARELKSRRLAMKAAQQQVETLEQSIFAAADALEATPAPEMVDTTALMHKLKDAQLVNREIDKRTRLQRLQDEHNEKQRQAQQLTRQMDERTERKQQAIANAKMPLDGLSFTEGEVLFEGIPLQQLGEAKQIRISIALVLARNPKLRLVRIPHGEALDDESMAALAKMAEEMDFYVWMAKVDPSGKVGIYLEDGEIKSINEN